MNLEEIKKMFRALSKINESDLKEDFLKPLKVLIKSNEF